MSKKHFFWLPLLIFSLFLGVALFGFREVNKPPREVTFFVSYNSTGLTAHTASENLSVEEALQRAGYVLTPDSEVLPERGSLLFRGTVIVVKPAQNFTIEDEHAALSFVKPVRTVEEALQEAKIELRSADFVEPELSSSLSSGEVIRVTRVTVSEETEESAIPFKKVEKEDDTLSWQTKKVGQKGVPGVLTIRYQVSRHNGRIVAKEKIEETVTEEPIDQVTVIGTKVTVIKKHNGAASWYAHTGTLSAANPWLPLGSYVRVTNKANGKSVIVKINDRGPFGPGRIIDLDKVAFEKIADLGTGVIDVLMEEIK